MLESTCFKGANTNQKTDKTEIEAEAESESISSFCLTGAYSFNINRLIKLTFIFTIHDYYSVSFFVCWIVLSHMSYIVCFLLFVPSVIIIEYEGIEIGANRQ